MLIVGPTICEVGKCSHGCTMEAGGCQEWRLNHAEQYLRDNGAKLAEEAARWGFAFTFDIRPDAPAGPVCGNCDTAVPPGCGGIFRDDGEHCALNRTAGVPAAGEGRGAICQPEGLMFDAFGNPRVRYVRVTLDGAHLILHPDELEAWKANEENPDQFTFTDVYLSEEEADALPEFDGF